MIEINLSVENKEQSLTKVGGIDFSKINVKGMLFAILFLYVPEIFLTSHFESQTEEINAQLITLRTEDRQLKNKVRGLENIEKQINALKEQEKRLAEKLNVVKEIINKKQNPFSILKYIADNTPKDIWVTELKLTESLDITLKGQSKSWKSIGVFIDNLKNSIFFAKEMSYTQPGNNAIEETNGPRYENFEIKAKIVRFD